MSVPDKDNLMAVYSTYEGLKQDLSMLKQAADDCYRKALLNVGAERIVVLGKLQAMRDYLKDLVGAQPSCAEEGPEYERS